MLCAKQNLTEGEQIMSKFLSKIYIFRWIFPLITSGSMVFWKVRRGGSASSSVRGIREVCERGAVKSRECDSDRRPTKCHRWRISRGLQIYPCLHDQQGSNDSHLNLIRHRDRLLVAPLTLRPAAHSHLWKSRFPPGERATGSYSKAGHPRFFTSVSTSYIHPAPYLTGFCHCHSNSCHRSFHMLGHCSVTQGKQHCGRRFGLHNTSMNYFLFLDK